VTGAGDFKVIGGDFKCSDRKAPEIDLLDFKRVSSGSSKTITVKLCNTGGQDIAIETARFSPDATSSEGESLLPDPFADIDWSTGETLDARYFTYYNPSASETYVEPPAADPLSPAPDATLAYSIREKSSGISPEGMVIAAGSFAKFEVVFAPTLDVDWTMEHPVFQPMNAILEMETSGGNWDINVGGGSGGRQPQLQASYTTSQTTTAIPLDLDHIATAIDFGNVEIFPDWIGERPQTATLILRNTGSGAEPLKIWIDPLTAGYFTFARKNPEQLFPLEIPSGTTQRIKIRYSPTPAEINPSADLGRVVIRHNGANGPESRIILLGREVEKNSKAVQVRLNGSNLGKHTYSVTSPKKLCAAIGATVPFDIEIQNNSTVSSTVLRTGWNLSSASAPVSGTGGRVDTLPGQTSAIHLTFNAEDLPVENEITGRLRLSQQFFWQGHPVTLEGFDVYFKILLSETGECEEEGGAVDGTATLIFDRITMNLIGQIFEPTRNHPAFKFHLPIDLDKTNGTARVHPLNFDPSPTVSPTKQIRSYAHQLTSIKSSCTDLPTNPYKLEFEAGSWDGPGKQCTADRFLTNVDGILADGSSACIKNNGMSPVTDPDDPTKTATAFHHEFVKIDPSTCEPEFYGRIATFLLKEGETISQVFQRMETEIGINREFEDYARITHFFGVGSYIHFAKSYSCGATSYAAGQRITDPDEIKNCWAAMAADEGNKRFLGMLEECSYFQFTIEEGKVPTDMTDPDSWEGFGTYAPRSEDDEAIWDMTIRNVHLQAFVLAHSLNALFTNKAKLLYSDLYVTLTTQAVGGRGRSDPDWQDLIAFRARTDFADKDKVYRALSDSNTKKYWTEDGINSQWTTGEVDDARECFVGGDTNRPVDSNYACRGNFEVTDDFTSIVHAGEPVNFSGGNRFLLVGLGGFHGKGELAPPFAQEGPDGTGAPLYFTFHGCIKQAPPGEELSETAGCYEERIDDGINTDDSPIIDDYVDHGLLEPIDIVMPDPAATTEEGVVQPKALINYKIMNEDRNRLTDYFNAPSHYRYDRNRYPTANDRCGYGM
ncbi:MAG: hypothetical protein Q7T11_09170, partial [Deltaproteobacteria bacterium]|nr:hypothetical protein [Deltaproteobacteria bacterium]